MCCPIDIYDSRCSLYFSSSPHKLRTIVKKKKSNDFLTPAMELPQNKAFNIKSKKVPKTKWRQNLLAGGAVPAYENSIKQKNLHHKNWLIRIKIVPQRTRTMLPMSVFRT